MEEQEFILKGGTVDIEENAKISVGDTLEINKKV